MLASGIAHSIEQTSLCIERQRKDSVVLVTGIAVCLRGCMSPSTISRRTTRETLYIQWRSRSYSPHFHRTWQPQHCTLGLLKIGIGDGRRVVPPHDKGMVEKV